MLPNVYRKAQHIWVRGFTCDDVWEN